jgi:hypothetical protein
MGWDGMGLRVVCPLQVTITFSANAANPNQSAMTENMLIVSALN